MDGQKSVKSFKLSSSQGHTLHVEEAGNPKGRALLFLHGGPGASIGQGYQWPFINTNYRIIAFDQRGCGKSQPFGSLENNTTQALISDIEKIRHFFDIEKWTLFGGSWGSTLALAYAISHPDKVFGMILRGIFLARPEDKEWFLSPKQGASQVFPLEYAQFTKSYKQSNKVSLCEYYFKQLTHSKESIRHQAANKWFNWEGSISRLEKVDMNASDCASIQQMYTLALLECYYIMNDCFLPRNYILENCNKIKHIPTHIVHGRYDMVCKCESAITLHQALPNSSLKIVEDAGHSMSERGISKTLINALKLFDK